MNKAKKKHQRKKCYIDSGQPLYNKEDFLLYFEHRMKQIVRDEVEILFKNLFFNAPF